MRTVFFGTPLIAVPALHALHEVTQVVGVICQPDRPRGRGLETAPCAVKLAALELGLPVHQPVRVRTGTLDQWLRERDVDLALVMAYGRILPKSVLDAPRLGCVNLHASLLPKYRGAAPIQWAIMEGETETGISLMQMEEGLDTGPVFTRRRIPINPRATAGSLAEELAELASVVVREDLPSVSSGQAPTPQDHEHASYAPPIEPRHCTVDWGRGSDAIVNQIRGLAPRPAAVTSAGGKRLRILRATVAEPTAVSSGPAGTIIRCEGDQLWVQCGTGVLRIEEAQLEGRRALPARDLINGRALHVGQVLALV